MGGGGSSRTTTEASLPPELRPAASGATQQILQMQQTNPLTQYASVQPGGTAGISPFQRATMANVPRLAYTPPGLQELLRLGQPVGMAAQGAVGTGDFTPAAQAALQSLSGRLGSNAAFDPRMAGAPGAAARAITPYLPTAINLPTVFPGATVADIQASIPTLLNSPVPVLYPQRGGTGINPGQGTAQPALPSVPNAATTTAGGAAGTPGAAAAGQWLNTIGGQPIGGNTTIDPETGTVLQNGTTFMGTADRNPAYQPPATTSAPPSLYNLIAQSATSPVSQANYNYGVEQLRSGGWDPNTAAAQLRAVGITGAPATQYITQAYLPNITATQYSDVVRQLQTGQQTPQAVSAWLAQQPGMNAGTTAQLMALAGYGNA